MRWFCPALCCLVLMSTPAATQVRPSDFDSVAGCKSLGEVTGKSGVCSLGRARANAMKRATALGATHIVWTNARCVLFAGHRAQGEIFDCNQPASPGSAFYGQRDGEGRGHHGPLGLYLDLIPTEKRAAIGRNTGAYVTGVTDESPAFFAEILVGDVILRADGKEVRTPKDLADVNPEATLVILRDGAERTVTLAR